MRASTIALLTSVLAITAASRSEAQIRAEVFVGGVPNAVAFVQNPADRTVQFVVQYDGHIRVVKNGALVGGDFLNVAQAISFGSEQGLLGLAFPADYGTSGRFFVNFTNSAGHTVVARFHVSANPLIADPTSRFDLQWGGVSGFIEQPFANHNGGNLAFGPDGFLYIGLGDGGAANDPDHRAQNPSSLLGKMLRIDVGVPDGDTWGYRIPADNPFVGTSARPEIWSFGLRNPWRYSFDDVNHGGTGALVIGDVGQGAVEEVDYQPANAGGKNYGWRNREGNIDNVTTLPPAYLPLTEPIFTYTHADGQSITGGVVYRGRALGPSYFGRYFFADYVARRVWSIALMVNQSTGEAAASDLVEHTSALGGSAAIGNVSAFGTDADGELYLVGLTTGNILRLLPAAPAEFTDPTLIPGVTPLKAVHVVELRSRVNALRSANGLAAVVWTDNLLVSGTTLVRAIHISELRSALAQAYASAGRPAPSYTDPTLPSGTPIKAVHISELRAAIIALGG
jgi:glucose/arabinose dehydrogenase